MLNKEIRVLNFDDSIIKQEKLIAQYKPAVIDLKGLASSARYFLSAKTRSCIATRINNSAKNSITFLGSGDFHHISEILISQFDEPVCVISFDLHPDWEVFPPRFGCGSWVSETLRKKNIEKLLLIGVASCDLNTFNIQRGNLAALKDNRVEIYPYAHKPSLTFFRKIPQNISIKTEGNILFSRIIWDELKDKNLHDFFLNLLKRLPQEKVYISIDKDCLRGEFCCSNWEEGMLSLDELLLMLKLIKENKDIVGLDITGDYSPISVRGIFKIAASYFDHPKKAKEDTKSAASLNEETNLKILQLFML